MFLPPSVMRSSTPSMIVPAPSVITKAETFDHATIPPIAAPTSAPSRSVSTIADAGGQADVHQQHDRDRAHQLRVRIPTERSKSPMIIGKVRAAAMIITTLAEIEDRLPVLPGREGIGPREGEQRHDDDERRDRPVAHEVRADPAGEAPRGRQAPSARRRA